MMKLIAVSLLSCAGCMADGPLDEGGAEVIRLVPTGVRPAQDDCRAVSDTVWRYRPGVSLEQVDGDSVLKYIPQLHGFVGEFPLHVPGEYSISSVSLFKDDTFSFLVFESGTGPTSCMSRWDGPIVQD